MKNIVIALLALSLFACTKSATLENSTTDNSAAASKTSAVISEPNLQRIKIATVGSQDVDLSTELYTQWFNYTVVEQGTISAALAASWAAPATAGKPYALLKGESGDDVFLRVIQVSQPKGYKAMTTYGWNAIEIIVEDTDQVYQNLLKSPFKHVGGPAFLGEKSTIRAVQFRGPSEEIFYFTTETGDRSKSTLLTPRAPIDRPFIMVLAGTDAEAITDFYINNFGAKKAFFIQTPIDIVAAAQNLPAEHLFPLGFLRLGEFSNSIEIDGYPKQSSRARPTGVGELPPGVSITSFSVNNLDLVDPDLFISTPATPTGMAYGGNRSATIIGPAGELIELIEE